MSAKKQKFYIASKYTCRIGFRKLTTFEERNPRLFNTAHAAFETWEDAHAWLLARRRDAYQKAVAVAASAHRQLCKAKEMKKPEPKE